LELLQNGDNEDGNHIIKLINLDIKNKKLIETKIVFYIRNYKNPNNFITFGFGKYIIIFYFYFYFYFLIGLKC